MENNLKKFFFAICNFIIYFKCKFKYERVRIICSMKIAAKVFLLLPIAFSCFSGEPAFVYGKDSIVSFPENSVADFNPCRDGERLVLILNGDSGENSYSGDTKLLSGTLRMNVSSYKGRIILRGGTLEIISENPKLYNLDWSSGGFKIDLKKHAPITLAESVNISALPQADDAFNFENISEGGVLHI